MRIAVVEAPGPDWDAFVATQPGASIYLRSGWSLLAHEVFAHRAFFVEARDAEGALHGVLPVVQQRGLLGNFMTSVAFFNYGGPLATSEDAAVALMERARELAQQRGASFLELRDIAPRAAQWSMRTDKASMILDLPASAEALGKQLGSKLRSQVKRAEREVVEVRRGGLELLDDFYDVFARNMRDLGTPVYPKRFFRTILERFSADTLLLVIKHQGRAAAAGFLVFDGQGAEIPWASCRADAKPLGMNMKLYWELLTTCIARGCRTFDFGRSTIDSGTYRFKQQWGAKPKQLYWHRWERKARPHVATDEASPGKLRQYAVALWRKLPLPLANMIGARISPGLPW